MIDKAYIDVDGGYGESPPYSTRAHLTLEGDFVEEFRKYIDNPNRNHVSLRIGFEEAHELLNSLAKVLYGS